MSDLTDEELRARLKYAMGERHLEPFVEPLRELQCHRAAQTASAERVRAVVRREVILACEAGIVWRSRAANVVDGRVIDAVADRVAAELTAPPPGHVCPVPYGLGPEDLDILEDLSRMFRESGGDRTSALLDKILAAHRGPEPTAAPLPEVIRCGTEGCVSSIRKSYLPSGWLLHEGTWRCPRCKVIATSEAS